VTVEKHFEPRHVPGAHLPHNLFVLHRFAYDIDTTAAGKGYKKSCGAGFQPNVTQFSKRPAAG